MASKKKSTSAAQQWVLPAHSHVWVYLRHSPGDNQTIDSQREGMQLWCAENGWVIDGYFIDAGVEGSREDRDQFQQMISKARHEARTVDGVVVWSFSRFARSQLDSQFYKAELRKLGYVVMSKIDDVPNSELAPLFESFIDWKNQRFLEDLSADTRRGIRYVLHSGFIVTSHPPIGYLTERVEYGVKRSGKVRYGRRLVKDEATAERVALAWQMKLTMNASLGEIFHATRLFSRTSGYSIFFSNRIYAGIFENGDEWLPVNWEQGERFCEPYVTLEQFDQVQQLRSERQIWKVAPRLLSSPYLLSGLLRCGICYDLGRQSAVSGTQWTKSQPQYRCGYRSQVPKSCTLPIIQARYIESKVMSELRSHILVPNFVEQIFQQMNQIGRDALQNSDVNLEMLEEKEKEARQAVDAIVLLMTRKGVNEVLEARYDEMVKHWDTAKQNVQMLRNKRQIRVVEQWPIERIQARFEEWIDTFNSSLLTNKQALLKMFIDHILLYPNRIVIQFRFSPDSLLQTLTGPKSMLFEFVESRERMV